MLSTYLSIAVVIGLSFLAGRAIMRATGRERWNGIEPAVGFAALMAVEGLLARIPGEKWALIAGLAILVGLSLYALRKARLADLPLSPFFWGAAALTLVIASIPFAVTGHWGLLGMGYNNDLGLHLAWAEWLRSGFGTEPSDGYPLGPHGLAASLTFVPKLSLGTVFIGQVMAIAILTVMTAWAALERLGNWRRLVASILVGLPYLMASYFAQGAFKELAAAMFLLAFIIFLPQVTPLPPGRRAKLKALAPLAVLLLGIVFTYSFPGLAWPAAVVVIWALADRDVRARLRPGAVWTHLKRPLLVIPGLVVLGLIAGLAWGPFGFGEAFSEVATSDAFGPVSVIEVFGVWLTSDYRLAGEASTPLPGLMGAIGVGALLVALAWWWKQPKSVYPLAFVACAVLYAVSLPWVGDYSLAKALVISSPVTMVVILTALLSGPTRAWKPNQGMEFGAWITLAAVFVIGCAASSFMVLRDASVSPPGRAAELAAFHDQVYGKTVLFGDQDRFAPYYLSGAKVSVPLDEFPDPNVIENERKPFQGDTGLSAIDFDSFDEETLKRHAFVITTNAAWTSMTPPFYTRVGRTDSFSLWRRTAPAFGRPIMNEKTMPAKLAICENEGGRHYSQLDGTATLMPEAQVGLRSDWLPDPDLRLGDSASVDLDLGEGEWRLSLQYFTPTGMTMTAPGYRRHFDGSINGQRLSNMDTGSNGQFWPAGVIEVTEPGPVTFTVKADEPTFLQKLTGYSRKTKLGRIIATRAAPRDRVPMSEICDRWVDFFRRHQTDADDARTKASGDDRREQDDTAPGGNATKRPSDANPDETPG
jgi:hypothetical protein